MRVGGAVLALVLVAAGAAAWTAQGSAPVLVPKALAFWNASRGLIGSGGFCDDGACPGAIALTTDGGRTSRVVLHTVGSVESLAVAPGGDAWATAGPAVLRSDDGGLTWRTIAHGISRPSFADASHGLAIAPTCDTPGCPQSHFVRTDDGGRTWHRLARDCHGDSGATAVSAVSRRSALLLCDGQPGGGGQGKLLYRSDDGWRTWHVVVSIPFVGIGRMPEHDAGLSVNGYAAGLAVSATGTGVLWQQRGAPIYVTSDGGNSWRIVRQFRPDDDFGMSASVSAGRITALLQRPAQVYRLVATASGQGPWRALRYWRP